MAAIVLCTINAKWIHPSLALRLLQANLPAELQTAENSIIIEFALRQNPIERITAILSEKPKILAVSVSIWNHETALELLRALYKEWAGSRPAVILGGPEVTPLPASAEIFKYADFVVRGEGEEVFAGLCRDILNDQHNAKNKYKKFIAAAPVNLNKINSAYCLYTKQDLERKLIYVESSRGCPFNCVFCQSAVKHGTADHACERSASGLADCQNGGIREFALERFFADMETLMHRSRGKIRTIKFLDRSFNVNIPRALQILDFCLQKTAEYNNGNVSDTGFQFHFEMVPGIFPAELKQILRRFLPGTIRLETGIQSLNLKTCTLINRPCNPEKELETLFYLRENTNAILHVDLIAGLPGEDYTSFAEGFDRLWAALSSAGNSVPFEIQPGILKILPGTPVCKMAEDGIFVAKYNKSPPYEVLETDCMPVCDTEKIKNFARFWELIANRRPFPDLLPLLAPPGKPVFAGFMELSQKLLACFGKNWGIPKNELEEELRTLIAKNF